MPVASRSCAFRPRSPAFTEDLPRDMPAMTNSRDTVDEEPLPVAMALDRRQPVADQVYQALRSAIVTVRLLPGTAISENRICRHFGVSRTPARAAVLRLAEEGLIDVYPQQGSFVSPIRMRDVEDARFIRRALEAAILTEAMALWTPEMSATARAIIDSQATALAAGDIERVFQEDMRFHRAFSVFAGREGVWDSILGTMARLSRIVRLFGRPDRLPVVIAEHHAIVDAIEAGDAGAAVRSLEYHLDRIFVMLKQVPERYSPYVTD